MCAQVNGPQGYIRDKGEIGGRMASREKEKRGEKKKKRKEICKLGKGKRGKHYYRHHHHRRAYRLFVCCGEVIGL